MARNRGTSTATFGTLESALAASYRLSRSQRGASVTLLKEPGEGAGGAVGYRGYVTHAPENTNEPRAGAIWMATVEAHIEED